MMENSRRHFLKNLMRATLGVTATTLLLPSMAIEHANDFETFMRFSQLITAEESLNPEFGILCWRYVQKHSSAEHLRAMHLFMKQAEPDSLNQALSQDPSLKSVAYHTLLVWYKGDVTSINPTGDEVKVAYINALKWKAIGIPAHGLCFPDWSKGCTT